MYHMNQLLRSLRPPAAEISTLTGIFLVPFHSITAAEPVANEIGEVPDLPGRGSRGGGRPGAGPAR